MDNPRKLEIHKKITAYTRGQLKEEEIQELWHEFARNPELLEDLEIELGLRKLIEEKSGAVQKAKTLGMPKYTWHIAAAAVLLIVVMLQFFKTDTPTTLESFVVQSIAPEHIETADGIRTKDRIIVVADSLLNLGFEAIISGNDARGLELFAEVIRDHAAEPYISKAYLNTGIIYYNAGNYDEAIPAFREVTERKSGKMMITEKGWWFLGNALVQKGELEQARKPVFKTYQMEGMFEEQAFKLLQKLNDDLDDYNSYELPPEEP